MAASPASVAPPRRRSTSYSRLVHEQDRHLTSLRRLRRGLCSQAPPSVDAPTDRGGYARIGRPWKARGDIVVFACMDHSETSRDLLELVDVRGGSSPLARAGQRDQALSWSPIRELDSEIRL